MRNGNSSSSKADSPSPGRWSQARNTMLKVRGILGQSQMEARVKQMKKEYEAHARSYHDNELYSLEKIRERMKHRNHPKVADILQRWWRVPQNSFKDPVTGEPAKALKCEQYRADGNEHPARRGR